MSSNINQDDDGLSARDRRIASLIYRYSVKTGTSLCKDLYVSSITALDTKLPRKIQFSAHGFRDLMQRLAAEITKRDLDEKRTSLHEDVRPLIGLWKEARLSLPIVRQSAAIEEIDFPSLVNFLEGMDSFYTKHESSVVPNMSIIEQMVRTIFNDQDCSNEDFVQGYIRRWKKLERTIMIPIAHAREVTIEEFESHIENIRVLFEDLFEQKVIDNLNQIDEIIKAGESS